MTPDLTGRTIVLHLPRPYAGFKSGYVLGKGLGKWQFDHLLQADAAYIQEPDGRLRVIKDRSTGNVERVLSEAESFWILLQAQ